MAVILFTEDVRAEKLTRFRTEADLIISASDRQKLTVQPGHDIQIVPTEHLVDRAFQSPYIAIWRGVTATNLEGMKIELKASGPSGVDVSIDWVGPGFRVQDMYLMTGRCFAVGWQNPTAAWHITGHLFFHPETNAVYWREFSMVNEMPGHAFAGLGDCDLDEVSTNETLRHLESLAQDPTWIGEILKQTIPTWSVVSERPAQLQIVEASAIEVNPCLRLLWEPTESQELPNGAMRVKAHLVFEAKGYETTWPDLLRTASEEEILSTERSMLILPKNFIEAATDFTSRSRSIHGLLRGREIPVYWDLAGNRKKQNFAWGDLVNFPLYHPMLFDFTTYGSVQLGNATPSGSTLQFRHYSRMAIHARADVRGEWVPYFDFRSSETGGVTAWIADGQFKFKMSFDNLHMNSYPQSAFKVIRAVEEFTNMDYINDGANRFFATHAFAVQPPALVPAKAGQAAPARLILGSKSLGILLEISGNPGQFSLAGY